jgi:hypothetical protein
MSATSSENDDNSESEREEERLAHCEGSGYGETILRPCNHCDDGWLWAVDTEVVCDHCHVTMFRTPGDSPTIAQRRDDSHGDWYQRDEYENSGRARLIGGYKQAYVASESGSKEYAIDEYGTVGDGIWTPHKRC